MSDFQAPHSRIEAILQNILGANNTLPEPISRNEALLKMIYEEGAIGGGSTKVKLDDVILNPDSEGYVNIPVDSTPTEDSTNLITSGAVYAVLGDIETALIALRGGNS